MTLLSGIIGKNRSEAPPDAATRPRRTPTPPKPHRPVDALSRFLALNETPKEYRALPAASTPSQAIRVERSVDDRGRASGRMVLPVGYNPLVAPPALLTLGGRPAIRGGAAIVAWLERRGVRCAMTADARLICSTPGGRMPLEVREIVRVADELIKGHLLDRPLPCALSHPPTAVGKGKAEPLPEAVSVIEPDLVPACAAHLAGELEP